MRHAAFALAIGVTWLGCGSSTPATSDAGGDATVGTPCNGDSDCPTDMRCNYPSTGGCGATKECFLQTSCKGKTVCACDGTTITTCAGASKPVAHPGPCNDGGPCGAACGSSLCCESCDVTGYAPITMGAARVSVGACTQQQLQAFVTACFSSGADTTSCEAWSTQDAGACAACLTPVLTSATAWGPLDCDTSSSPCAPNEGGCVDLVLHTTADEAVSGGSGSCGDTITVKDGCVDYGCSTCTGADVLTCEQSAVANECATYQNQVVSTTGLCAALQGDASSSLGVCFPQTDADNIAFVNVFCGTGP